MDDCTYFDDTFFSVLKECKTLPNFLNSVFGFLRRRTDFYCVATDQNSTVGLPPGFAEHFTKEAFHKWKPAIINDAIEVPAIVGNEVEVTTTALDKEVSQLENKTQDIKITSNVIASNDFTPSESYNGSTFDNYSWSQTISDLDIIVKIPENVPSRNLIVNILPQKIFIAVKNCDTILLNGDFCHKVKHSDAIWSVDKQKLEIHLEKTSEIWWNCLVQNEPKINVSKIDCSRPFEELPEEAQAKIEELTWNQERKRLGLPTSEELVLQERLKRAWNVEGSPFKGPYDPNSVIIN